MIRMPSLLESRTNLLHLWTSLDWKRIQPTCSPMATGCFLNPALRHQKRATSWCSARQKLKHKKSISWPTTRGRDLAVLKRRASRWEDQSCCPSSEEYERYKKNWYISLNKSGRKCTDETPIRLPRSTYKYAPSPPRIWRRAT